MRRNDGSGDPLFTERDPKGRSVVLEKERYIEHIQTRHPEISIEAIRSCVSSPDYIIADRRYYSRENYFAHSCPDHPNHYVKAVVSENQDIASRKVITSYLTDDIDPMPANTEDIVYDKKKNHD